ncbi:unnamed protein product [Onchocerca flexuosa]|uniref:tRNA pseudouridine(55) synthase n=1 Tax=Onchocerca flexuosa TaxID=387005 RepID=A0A183HTU0_9BILA|nr:unnamed protein product [Onchocerca flexuosa]
METQAGTYVKEFVHGDFGRTRPSLADLLNVECGEIDILELDVEGVDMEWPPKYWMHNDRLIAKTFQNSPYMDYLQILLMVMRTGRKLKYVGNFVACTISVSMEFQ